MEKPLEVQQGVIAVWASIGISVLASLIGKWIGDIDAGAFAWMLVFYAIFCILPYKLGVGSNAARYVYLVLFIVSVLVMAGGLTEGMTLADYIASIIVFPLEIFAIVRLFQSESNEWFTKK